jgi:hypothetical protein
MSRAQAAFLRAVNGRVATHGITINSARAVELFDKWLTPAEAAKLLIAEARGKMLAVGADEAAQLMAGVS